MHTTLDPKAPEFVPSTMVTTPLVDSAGGANISTDSSRTAARPTFHFDAAAPAFVPHRVVIFPNPPAFIGTGGFANAPKTPGTVNSSLEELPPTVVTRSLQQAPVSGEIIADVLPHPPLPIQHSQILTGPALNQQSDPPTTLEKSTKPNAKPPPPRAQLVRDEVKPAYKGGHKEDNRNTKPGFKGKSDLKSDSKPDTKLEPKPDLKTASKPEIRPAEIRSDTKCPLKSGGKYDAKSEAKSEAKPDVKLDSKLDAKLESKLDSKVDVKGDRKSEARSEVKADPKVEARVEQRVETKLPSKLESKAETKGETRSENKSDAKSNTKSDNKPENSLERKTENTATPELTNTHSTNPSSKLEKDQKQEGNNTTTQVQNVNSSPNETHTVSEQPPQVEELPHAATSWAMKARMARNIVPEPVLRPPPKPTAAKPLPTFNTVQSPTSKSPQVNARRERQNNNNNTRPRSAVGPAPSNRSVNKRTNGAPLNRKRNSVDQRTNIDIKPGQDHSTKPPTLERRTSERISAEQRGSDRSERGPNDRANPDRRAKERQSSAARRQLPPPAKEITPARELPQEKPTTAATDKIAPRDKPASDKQSGKDKAPVPEKPADAKATDSPNTENTKPTDTASSDAVSSAASPLLYKNAIKVNSVWGQKGRFARLASGKQQGPSTTEKISEKAEKTTPSTTSDSIGKTDLKKVSTSVEGKSEKTEQNTNVEATEDISEGAAPKLVKKSEKSTIDSEASAIGIVEDNDKAATGEQAVKITEKDAKHLEKELLGNVGIANKPVVSGINKREESVKRDIVKESTPAESASESVSDRVPEPSMKLTSQPLTASVAEPAKEPVRDSIDEPIEENPKEPKKESAKEAAMELMKESVEEAPKESMKEPVKESVEVFVAKPVGESSAEISEKIEEGGSVPAQQNAAEKVGMWRKDSVKKLPGPGVSNAGKSRFNIVGSEGGRVGGMLERVKTVTSSSCAKPTISEALPIIGAASGTCNIVDVVPSLGGSKLKNFDESEDASQIVGEKVSEATGTTVYPMNVMLALRSKTECQSLPDNHNLPGWALKEDGAGGQDIHSMMEVGRRLRDGDVTKFNIPLALRKNNPPDLVASESTWSSNRSRLLAGHKSSFGGMGHSGGHGSSNSNLAGGSGQWLSRTRGSQGNPGMGSSSAANVAVPEIPEDSWQKKQEKEKAETGERGIKVLRRLRAQLNKMTPTTYESILGAIVDIGIEDQNEAEEFVKLIFDKATTNHGYVAMYADLFYDLKSELEAKATREGKQIEIDFRRMLLQECQNVFQKSLANEFKPKEGSTEEEEFEELLLYKKKIKGNLMFVGYLAQCQMVPTKVLLTILQQTLDNRKPLQLEALASFLPTCLLAFKDKQKLQDSFDNILENVREISHDESVELRVRCLLTDGLDALKAQQDLLAKKEASERNAATKRHFVIPHE